LLDDVCIVIDLLLM